MTFSSLTALLSLVVLTGAGTWYSEEEWGGNLMACNCRTALGCDLRYSSEVPVPWGAVDPWYLARGWKCGDPLLVAYGDGAQQVAYILDTGDLRRHSIAELGYAEIVLDVSERDWLFHPRLSAPARVVNVGLARRVLERFVEP